MIDESVEFVETFIGRRAHTHLSYREAFILYADVDPFLAPLEDLISACRKFEGYPVESSSRDELLNLLMGMQIEPSFDKNDITVLRHYPASQAALARKTTIEGQAVAERFEIYAGGLELANGYHELGDPAEQEARFLADNALRARHRHEAYPIDFRLLEALQQGLPDCCGVAVGVDRLLMLRHNAASIHDVMPISWALA